MSIGVIPLQMSIVNPQHLLGMEQFLELPGYIVTGERLIAVRSKQATSSGEHRAIAVGLDRATFKNKVVVIDVGAAQHAMTVQTAVDGIVKIGRKLVSPTIESEIE